MCKCVSLSFSLSLSFTPVLSFSKTENIWFRENNSAEQTFVECQFGWKMEKLSLRILHARSRGKGNSELVTAEATKEGEGVRDLGEEINERRRCTRIQVRRKGKWENATRNRVLKLRSRRATCFLIRFILLQNEHVNGNSSPPYIEKYE